MSKFDPLSETGVTLAFTAAVVEPTGTKGFSIECDTPDAEIRYDLVGNNQYNSQYNVTYTGEVTGISGGKYTVTSRAVKEGYIDSEDSESVEFTALTELSLESVVGHHYVKDGVEVICLYNDGEAVYACDIHDFGYYYNGLDSDYHESVSSSVTNQEEEIIVFDWGGNGVDGFSTNQSVGTGLANSDLALTISGAYSSYYSTGTTIWTALNKLREDRGNNDWFIPSLKELQLAYEYFDAIPNLNTSSYQPSQSFLWSSSAMLNNTSRSWSLNNLTGGDNAGDRFSYFACRAFIKIEGERVDTVLTSDVQVGDLITVDGIKCIVIAKDITIQGSTHNAIAIDHMYDLGHYVNYVGETQDGYEITQQRQWRWGGYGTYVSGLSTSVGYGLQNTTTCLATSAVFSGGSENNTEYPLMWQGVNDFRDTYGTDWFIPSSQEIISYIYPNNTLLEFNSHTGAETANSWYWSSSSTSSQTAVNIQFNGGTSSNNYKYSGCYVRMCRAITIPES